MLFMIKKIPWSISREYTMPSPLLVVASTCPMTPVCDSSTCKTYTSGLNIIVGSVGVSVKKKLR